MVSDAPFAVNVPAYGSQPVNPLTDPSFPNTNVGRARAAGACGKAGENMLDPRKVRLGIAPIGWTNDDMNIASIAAARNRNQGVALQTMDGFMA